MKIIVSIIASDNLNYTEFKILKLNINILKYNYFKRYI
jgi:hypothetical protein